MDFGIVLLVLVTVSSSFAQEGDYLVELKLSLKEETVPYIVNNLLNNSLEEHNISTGDIIKLSKLDKYNFDDTLQVLDYFNTTSAQTFTVDNLDKLLDSLKIQFPIFFRDLTSKLDLTEEQTAQIIRDLSIPDNFWMRLSMNQEERIYDSLKQGQYDEQHVNSALSTSKKNRNEVYSAARDLVLVEVLKLTSPEFMTLLKRNGWDRRTFLRMYDALNVTTRDIYDVEKFRGVFTNLTDSLNMETKLGVFVGANRLVVHELVYKYFEDGFVRVQANGVDVKVEKNGSLGRNIVELATVQPGPDYIEIIENYTRVEDCIYVTILDGRKRVEEVKVEDFEIEKSDKVRFVPGSPLICDGFLYGLAREEDNLKITFDGFYTEDNPQLGETEAESSAERLTFNLIILVCLLNIYSVTQVLI